MPRMKIGSTEIPDANIFEIIFENFPDMIHSVDHADRIIYANKKHEQVLGYPRAELRGMEVRQLYAEEVRDKVEAGFRTLKADGEKTVESLLCARDGTLIPVEVRSFGIYDDAGTFMNTFSIFRDLREIKALQASLIHAGRLAAIGEMASGIVHDINNPITTIFCSDDLALQDLDRFSNDPVALREAMSRRLTDSLRAAEVIRALSERLRNFARGVAEKRVPVDLGDLLAEALFLVGHKFKELGVTIDNRVEPGRCFTLGAPNQVEQVFVNLIANACDAVAGRADRIVRLEADAAQHEGVPCWRIRVNDTGPGVPPGMSEEIFQSFFTTKERGKGTGLGLAMARGIARDHRGEITVESLPGLGATFSVLLPRLEETPGRAAVQTGANPGA
jgi:two-component system NtrC family sensor kinase